MVINTDADVIRVIRQSPRLIFQAMSEDPELLAEVRRAILTDELLGLPAQFAEMQTDLAETRRVQNEMLETQNRILADLAETRRVQSEMLETQNRILADLNLMSGRLGNLEGGDLERKMFRILPGRLYPMYGLRRPRILMHPITESQHTEVFRDEIADANENGFITDTQFNRLMDTYMILRARKRKNGKTVYCAIEASSVIDNSDVSRAMESSQALHTVYGDRTIPVVMGYSITDDAMKMADGLEVGVAIVSRPS